MTYMRSLFAGIALLGLSACWGEEDSNTVESSAESESTELADAGAAPEPATEAVEQPASDPVGPPILMPGSWDMRGKMLEYELTGVETDVAAQKEKYWIGRPMGLSQSLTETMAIKPSGNFLAATGTMGCTDDITMLGGKISGTMSCPAEGGGFSKSTVTGSYTPDKYAVTVETTGPVVFRGSSPGASEYRKYKIAGQNLDALAKSQGY